MDYLLARVISTILASVPARFEVVEQSMAPSLLPGDYLITRKGGRPPGPGDIVVFEHPDRPGFHLVKRVASVEGETAWVLGDNEPLSSGDSREIGPVPLTSLKRVVFRYWPPSRVGFF
jgi:nickel-type superoxide dismutase maturation protease